MVSVAIFAAMVLFAVRYRRRRGVVAEQIEGSTALEITWSIIPLGIFIVIFLWGAVIYFKERTPPRGATEVYVVAKQWMWKFQHLDGQREINELHIPYGRRVKLTMTTEDVIHSFYVPAFRVKMDVVPGKYSSIWFEPTKPGRYQLFCAEYCGTSHSGMIGWVDVMDPSEYQAWLSGGAGEGSLASSGQKLFQDLACNTCHRSDGQGRGPRLDGLFGSQVQLQDGQKIVADESYIRESILNPKAKIVAGYQAVMPTFQGLVSEEQLLQLIAYVRSLGQQAGGQSSSGGQTGPTVVPLEPQTQRQGNRSAEPDAPGSNPTVTRPQSGARRPPQ